MDSTANKLTSSSTSYRCGFSYGINENAYSAYNDLSKVEFKSEVPVTKRRLQEKFLNGWKEGYSLRREVKRELEAEVQASI